MKRRSVRSTDRRRTDFDVFERALAGGVIVAFGDDERGSRISAGGSVIDAEVLEDEPPPSAPAVRTSSTSSTGSRRGWRR